VPRPRIASALVAALLAAGCTFDPGPYPGPGDDDGAGDDSVGETSLMRGFSYVDDRLAGMPSPGYGPVLQANLEFLAAEGVDLLVSLTEDGVGAGTVGAHGMRWLHLPVQDFTAPTIDQFVAFTAATRAALDRGETVGVHCGAGLGRTGTMLAAYFVTTGMTADAAIARVRDRRPGSIETASQERAIEQFADLLPKLALDDAIAAASSRPAQ
jgi:atypical dual specificity phosphatase